MIELLLIILISLFLIIFISKKPKQNSVNIILLLFSLIPLYHFRNHKKFNKIMIIMLFIVYLLVIFNENIEEGFTSETLKKIKEKPLLSEKFKGKMSSYTGSKNSKEKFSDKKIYTSNDVKNDIYKYYNDFSKTTLDSRSKSVYESLMKLYVLKDKLFDIF